MEVSWGFTARRGVHPCQQRGEEVKQGDGQLRGARCGRRRAPACLPGRQAARWRGAGLGRLGEPATSCQVSPLLSAVISVFYFFLQLCGFIKNT